MDNVLEVKHLSKQYGMAPPIISNFNFAFRSGTITGLKGNNGSGKSTLIKMLAFTSIPDSGTIELNSIDVRKNPGIYLNQVGIVADWFDLPSLLSFDELLIWRMEKLDFNQQQQTATLTALKNEFGFDERSENPIGSYSSGMKKKTAICAALCVNPSILLFDEPFLTLDVSTQKILENRLLKEKSEGKIILLATHNDEHEEKLFDNLIQFPLH